jgi:hypothetical protein
MWNKDISKLTDAELDERSKKDLASAPAQPQPRGSEAQASEWSKWDVFVRENVKAKRLDVITSKLRELAAATAERTNLATESPVAETVAIGAGDSHAGSQSHQTAERTPPGGPYEPVEEIVALMNGDEWTGLCAASQYHLNEWIKTHRQPAAERTPEWFPNEGDRQYWLEKNCRDVPVPAPPQPEAPEKEKP